MNLPLNSSKLRSLLLISVILAAILSFSLKSHPLDEQLINLAVAENLGYVSKLVANEPIETKAILLDYAGNQELVLKAWLALKKYPHIAPPVFVLYGQDPTFQKVLLQFGENIIPVIDYFIQHEVSSLTVQATVANIWQSIKNTFSADENQPDKNILAELTPQQRGWYALNYINQEGYNFLAQFAIDKQGKAQWIQTDRTTKALVSLFTSGIRELETKYKTDAEITNEDILWASVDVFALASSVKLLRASKAVTASKGLSYSQKSLGVTRKISLFSFKLVKNKTVQRLFKYSAIGTTLYIVAAHPSLINSMLDELAHPLNLNPALVKMGAWFVLIFLLLQPLLWGFNIFVKPLIWLTKKALPS